MNPENNDWVREQQADLLKWRLAPLLKKYLARPSLDGRADRQEMRKELQLLLDENDNYEN